MGNESLKKRPQKLFIEPLEQRIMLDGAGASTFLDLIDERNQQQIKINSSNKDIYKEGENSNKDIPFTNITRDKIRNDKKNIVFIDSAVEDYETITSSFKENTEFYLINSNEDGFKRISEILKDKENIDALHLIGHGSSGQILFGNAFLNNETIDNYQATLTSIGQSLTTSGDILFYGCNIASTEQGEILIKKISEITKADIAASDDLTGKDGNWDLEKEEGFINVKELKVQHYDHSLGSLSSHSGAGISHKDSNVTVITSSSSNRNLGLKDEGLGGLVDHGDGFGIALERQNISISSGTLISQVDVDSDYSLSKSTSGVSDSYAYLTGDSEQNASENMTVDSYLMFLGAKNTIFGSSTGGLNRRSSTYSGEVVFEGEIVGIFFDQSRTRGQEVDGITYHNTSTYTYDFDESSPHTESNQYDTDKGRILEPGSFFGNDTSSTDSSGDWVSVGNYGSGTNNYLRFGADNNSVATGDYIRIIVKQAITDGSATVEEDGSVSVSNGWSASSPDPVTVDSGSTLSSSSFTPRRMTFSDDGTKLFILDYANDKIDIHNLGTAYDISTQTSSPTVDIALAGTPHTSAYGIEFSTDGTKMFTSDLSTGYVYQWTLTTPWDVSTNQRSASDDLDTRSLFGVTLSGGYYNRDITFSEDGTKLFILGSDRTVHQISLGTAWDLSSYQTPDIENDLSSTLTTCNSISFSPNGKKMFINEINKKIHEWSLATAWDLSSTVTYEGNFQSGSEISSSNYGEVTWNKDGTKLFILDGVVDDVTEYSVSTPFSLANVDQTKSAESISTVSSIRTGQSGGSGTSGSTNTALTGTYGQLTIQSNGSYSYVANQDAADALDAGDVVYDYFTINGDTDLTITVIGINDTPIAVDETNSTDVSTTLTVTDGASDLLTNDSDDDADASLTISQIVATTAGGSAQSVSSTSTYSSNYTTAEGSYGDLRIGADGTYHYIAGSSSGTDEFTYTVTDEFGATTTATLTITVNATNTAPTATADTGYIQEGKTLTVTNGLAAEDGSDLDDNNESGDHTGDVLENDTDADVGDSLTVTSYSHTSSTGQGGAAGGSNSNSGTAGLSSVAGTYGTLDLEDDGSYTYTADSNITNLDTDDETFTDVFTYTVSDGNGGTHTATITITIEASAAPVAQNDTGTVNEDGTLTVANSDNATSVAAASYSDSDSLTIAGSDSSPATTQNRLEDMIFNDDGTKMYVLGYESGVSGGSLFQYTLSTPFDVSIASVSSDDYINVGSRTENNEAIRFNNDGTKLFVLADSTGQNVTSYMHQYTLSTPYDITSTVTEGTRKTLGTSSTDNFRSFLFNDDGSKMFVSRGVYIYEYTLSTSFDTSTASSPDNSFYVTNSSYGLSNYGSSYYITGMQYNSDGTKLFTVHQTTTINHTAKIVEWSLSTAYDPTTASTNADFNDTSTYFETGDTTTASLSPTHFITFNNDGSKFFSFSDHAVFGDTLKIKEWNVSSPFSMLSTSGSHSGDIIDTSSSSNSDSDADGDSLTITYIQHSGAGSATSVTDVTYSNGSATSVTGTYGTLTIGSDGSYQYVADLDAADALDAGDIETDVFTYTVDDGNGETDTATLTITVNGMNDAPTAVADTDSVDAGSTVTDEDGEGTLVSNDTDPDASPSLYVTKITHTNGNTSNANYNSTKTSSAVTIIGSKGTLTFGSDGSYSYAANSDATSGDDVFTYTLTDGTSISTATLTISVTEVANNAPTITAQTDVAGAVTEITDGASGEGTNNLTDTGSFTIADLDNDNVTVSSAEGTTDAVGGSFLGALTATVADDTDDGSGQINWTYTVADADVEYLKAGETVTETFTVTVSDGNGGTVDQTVTVVITGANDAPTLTTGAVDVAVNEASDASAQDLSSSGTITFADLDETTSITAADTTVTGSAGVSIPSAVNTALLSAITVTDNSNNTASWALSATDLDLDFLTAGQTITLEKVVTATDGQSATVTDTITVTITGTNDAPTLTTGAVDVAVNEASDASAQDLSSSGTITFADLDETTSITAADTTVTGSAGVSIPSAVNTALLSAITVTDNSNNTASWALSATDLDLDFLTAGQTITLEKVVTATDGQSATVTDTITVTITGTNDAPTLTTGAVDVAVNEASDASAQDLSSSGTITFADLDETTSITAADTTVTGSAGVSIPSAVNTALLSAITVTDNSNNTASWALSATDLDLDFLTAGQTITLEKVVTATDGQSATVTDTITVTITGTNDAPTITAQTDVAGAVTEITDGASGEGTNNLTDTGSFTIADLDNDNVTVSSAEGTTDAVGGSFLGALTATVADDTDDGSGQINWTYTVADADVEYLKAGETVTETFTVTVSDGNGGTVDQTVTVVITGANDAPVANNDTINVAAGTPATGNVVTNDTDPDGDSLIVSAIAEGDVDSPITGTYGTFTLNSDGSYTYTVDTLNADVIAWQSGDPALTETFTYTVSDGNGGTDTATITVNASGQNDAPTAANNAVTTNEDTDHTFSESEFNFTDPDGDSLDHISIETLPSNGTLLLNGVAVSLGQNIPAADISTLVFRPAADGNGDDYDSFTFSVNDGTVDSGSYTMTVNVDAVNDAPTAVDDTINVTVGTPATGNVVTANDTDPDSDPLTVSAIAGGSVGSAITGTYGSFTLNSNGSYTYTVDTLNADVIAWKPGDAVLTETFTYTVSDGNGGTNDATITVNASGQNDAPTAADNAVTTNEDTDHTFSASEFGFTDVDSDSLDHVTIETLPSKGTLLLDGSAVSAGDEIAAADITNLVFRPAADGNGDDYDSFTFSVNDGTVDSGSYTMTVNVDAVNDAPTAADNAVTTNEDTDHTFSASEFGFTDVDSDSLDHVTIETLPSKGTLLLDGSAVSAGDEIAAADITNLVFRPAADGNGDDYDSFTFSVNDGTVDSGSYTMTVNVTPVNDVPTITATTENDFTEGSTSADDTVSVFNIGDTETSDSNLELSISNTTYYSITNNNDGTATVTLTTAGANYVNAGNDLPSYTVTVKDESNATATATHDPTVTPTDDTPIITATTENNFTEGSTSTGDTVAVFDVDDEETADGSLLVTIISGNDNGYYEISYDNAGTATVTLTSDGADYVNAGNDLPEYTVQVSDGSLTTTTSHNPTTLDNTKPEASDNTVTTLEDTSYTFSSNDFGFTDDDGNTLSSVTVSSLGTNGNGTFTLNGVAISGSTTVTKAQIDNGLLKFTPSSGDNGSSYNTYTFTVNDGTDDSSSSYTMTINVTAVNDAPVATDDASSVDEDSRVRVSKNGDDLLNDDSDPENDSLKVTLIKVLGGSNNSISNGSSTTITGTYGQLTVNSNGGYTYRANQDAADTLDTGESAEEKFVYTVSDGNGGTDTGILTITINGVEDNPNAVKDNVSLNISENSTLTGNAITNDIDPDDSLTIVGCGQGQNPNNGTPKTVGTAFNSNYGQMTINADGTYTFVAASNINDLLDPGQSVTERFYYTISDGNSTSTAMIEVTVQRDNVVQELTRKEQKQIKKQIANERLNQPSTIRLLNNTTPAKTIEQTANALDNISNTKKLSFNEGIKLVDLVAETGSLQTTDGSLDKVRAKEKDGQLNLSFKVSTDLGNQIVRYEGVMPDGSKLPDWIKVDPQTGKTTTNIPEGVEQVDFTIIVIDQQNNKKEIAVSIDPKEIREDKSIFKQAKKQNASLSVDQSGNVNIVNTNESGEVNQTETKNLNANEKQNSSNNIITQDLNLDNTNDIKNIIDTIKSDQVYQLQTINNGETLEIKVPETLLGNFEKTKLVLKDGSAIPDWVEFDPITGEINANPPEDVDKLEFKLIIERDGEIIVKDLAVDVGGDDNAQILDDIENAKFIAFKDQLNKEHENWEEYGSNIINRL